jgi:hypothetical protein
MNPTMMEYPNLGVPQDEPFKDKRLIKKENLYLVVSYLGADTEEVGTAYGLYDFVVLPTHADACFVRRERFDRDSVRKTKGKEYKFVNRGHSSIAQCKPVLMAGTMAFGGGPTTKKTEKGELLWWENKSGHYFIRGMRSSPEMKFPLSGQALKSHVEFQTQHLKCSDGGRLLPMEKFREWDGDI